MLTHRASTDGFSLIQMSTILAVAGILLVSALPGGTACSCRVARETPA